MNQDFIVHKKAISCFVFLICLPCISCGTYCNEDKCCVVAYPAADFCVAWLVNLISGVIIIFFCFFVSLARDKGIIGRGHDLRLLACLRSHVLRACCNFESKQVILILCLGTAQITRYKH